MEFDDNFKAITQDELLPKAVDLILNDNIHSKRALSNMKAWRGEKLGKSIITEQAGTGKSFSGADKFNTNKAKTKKRIEFDPRGLEQPVVIIGMEADTNASSDRSVDLVAEAIEEAANEMADNAGTILYTSLGTGTFKNNAIVSDGSNKNFFGLDAIIDDGGEVPTWGGQSRATIPGLQGNETDVGGALTLAVMAAMYDSCKSGSDMPTIIYTTEAIWSDYEALAQAVNQINQDGTRPKERVGAKGTALTGELGFESLRYRGVPIVADEKCPTGKMYFVNERHIAFYGLKSTRQGYTQIKVGGNKHIEGIYSQKAAESLGFAWSGFLVPTDQYAEIGHMILMGNYISFHPRRHGVLNTIS
jgi:hypothetical protein